MSAVDPLGAAPQAREPAFLWLLFGCSAAPVFWIGQLTLGYSVTAYGCYPGDVPLLSGPGFLPTLLMVFDAVALAVSLAGGAVSLSAWLRTRNAGEGRNSFLAIWGLFSSMWFFSAILFNTIASVMVPLCGE